MSTWYRYLLRFDCGGPPYIEARKRIQGTTQARLGSERKIESPRNLETYQERRGSFHTPAGQCDERPIEQRTEDNTFVVVTHRLEQRRNEHEIQAALSAYCYDWDACQTYAVVDDSKDATASSASSLLSKGPARIIRSLLVLCRIISSRVSFVGFLTAMNSALTYHFPGSGLMSRYFIVEIPVQTNHQKIHLTSGRAVRRACASIQIVLHEYPGLPAMRFVKCTAFSTVLIHTRPSHR